MDTHSPKDSYLKEIQGAYWCALNKVLDEVGGPIRGDKRPRPKHDMCYWSRSRSGAVVGLTAMMNTKKKRVEVKLWVNNGAKCFFSLLEQQKKDIEEKFEFEDRLKWGSPKSANGESKIAVRCECVPHPRNKEDWPKQHKWLADHLNQMHEFFVPLVETWLSRTERHTQDRAVLRHLRSLPSNADPKLKYGPGGEGTHHRNLKELIVENPDRLNLGPGKAKPEHRFRTGDRVDVWIKLKSGEHCVVEIELEGYPSTLTGAHQALKYRALLAAQLDTTRLPHAFLVAHRIPQPIKEFCERHGVVALEIPQD